MVLTISGVLLLFLFVMILVRGGGLRLSHALVCVLLGFYLAGTSAAPTIREGVNATADLVSDIDP